MSANEMNQAIAEVLSTPAVRYTVDQVFNPRQDNFLINTFFGNTETFSAQKVEIDYRLYRQNVAAQFTAEKAVANLVEPDYRDLIEITPITLKERLVIEVDAFLKLTQRGEDRYRSKTLKQKFTQFLIDNVQQLSRRFYTRYEAMAADLLFNGECHAIGAGVDCKHSFWPETDKPYTKTATSWDDPAATILDDIASVAQTARIRSNISPNIMIMGPDVKAAMLNNDNFMKLFDIRRASIGSMEQKYRGNGLVYLGRLDAVGVDMYSYEKTYCEDSKKAPGPFIPEGKVMVGYAGKNNNMLGRKYGAVPIEEGTDNFTMQAGEVVSEVKRISQDVTKGWQLAMYSRPVFFMLQPQAYQVIEAVHDGD